MVKLLADVDPAINSSYLKAVDKSAVLVTMVYNIAQSSAAAMGALATPKADSFQEGLYFDDNGNLMATLKIGE